SPHPRPWRSRIPRYGSNPLEKIVSGASTNTGTPLSPLLSLPSWPYWFVPQHSTRPPDTTAQLCCEPTPIALAPLARPLTLTGTSLSLPEPSPSWPQLLLPQHLTPPPLVRAQVWPSPAAIAATPLESPLTSTGTWRSVLLLSPSSPYSFEPQHFAPPLPVTAQVWKRPALIAITPLERPLTFTGAYCSVVEL